MKACHAKQLRVYALGLSRRASELMDDPLPCAWDVEEILLELGEISRDAHLYYLAVRDLED